MNIETELSVSEVIEFYEKELETLRAETQYLKLNIDRLEALNKSYANQEKRLLESSRKLRDENAALLAEREQRMKQPPVGVITRIEYNDDSVGKVVIRWDSKSEPILGDNVFLSIPLPAQQVAAEGLEIAAAFIEKKVKSYLDEHGSFDPSTGCTELPKGGEDYVYNMEELAEEIRSLSAVASLGEIK